VATGCSLGTTGAHCTPAREVTSRGCPQSAGTSVDVKVRDSLMRQVGQITHADPPWILMWNNHSIWGVRKTVGWKPRVDDLVSVFDDVRR
jgi:hypothetical protein